MAFVSNPALRQRGNEVFAELYAGSNADAMHEEYVRKSSDFHSMSVEWCQGGLIGRPGLDLRAREIGILTLCVADGRVPDATIAHAHACLRAGMSKREIYEVILQTIWYVGAAPASLAFTALQGFFDDMEDA